ncbi:MAG: hypothetical protein WD772_03105 [Pseudohongiellaceae bacterium]
MEGSDALLPPVDGKEADGKLLELDELDEDGDGILEDGLEELLDDEDGDGGLIEGEEDEEELDEEGMLGMD